MDNEEKKVESSAQATNNSIAIDNFSANGNTGTIQIGNVTNVYNASDPNKSAFVNKSIDIKPYEPETILIPEGTFWMGSDPGGGIPIYETPSHEVFVPVYRIGKCPVTNKQFAEFIRKTGRPFTDIGWKSLKISADRQDHPVTRVNSSDAIDYCLWLRKETGRPYSLPNEALF